MNVTYSQTYDRSLTGGGPLRDGQILRAVAKMIKRRIPVLVLTAVLTWLCIFWYLDGFEGSEAIDRLSAAAKAKSDALFPNSVSPPLDGLESTLKGKPIMSKMANQTVRAELGRAAWKVFHTILAQYPEEPSADAKATLKNYIYLFSRVYPCAECAGHFQEQLAKYPPQVSSRKTAVLWGCDAHNKVNKRLGKEIFDCANIDDKYDCGCGSPEEDAKNEETEKPAKVVKGG